MNLQAQLMNDSSNRRDRYRIAMDGRILVKSGPHFEVGAIQNVSKGGVYFIVSGHYERGQSVDVTFPYDPAVHYAQKSQFGDVVRVQSIEGSGQKGVAVKLLDMFLKPSSHSRPRSQIIWFG